MTFLTPGALWLGGAGLLATVVAHLLVQRQPRALALATTRFLPAGTLTAATVQPRPTHWWWLLLRSAVVTLLALGVAGPVRSPTRVPARTVFLLDDESADSVVRRVLRSARATDVVIWLDSAPRLAVPADTVLTPADTARLGRRGGMSATILRVARMRDSLARATEQLTIRLVSPLARHRFDAATPDARALLPDPIVVERAAARPVAPSARPTRVTVTDGPEDDILRLAYERLVPPAAETTAVTRVLVQRGDALGASDSAAARDGAAVVWWPAGLAAESVRRVPSLAAVHTEEATWVAPLARGEPPRRGRPIAWWQEGAPAAVEEASGRGCLRQVMIGVPQRGDRVLAADAAALLRALVRPCGPAASDTSGIVDAELAWLAPAPRAGAPRLAAVVPRSTLAPWLLGAALLLAVLEAVLRARTRS